MDFCFLKKKPESVSWLRRWHSHSNWPRFSFCFYYYFQPCTNDSALAKGSNCYSKQAELYCLGMYSISAFITTKDWLSLPTIFAKFMKSAIFFIGIFSFSITINLNYK